MSIHISHGVQFGCISAEFLAFHITNSYMYVADPDFGYSSVSFLMV